MTRSRIQIAIAALVIAAIGGAAIAQDANTDAVTARKADMQAVQAGLGALRAAGADMAAAKAAALKVDAAFKDFGTKLPAGTATPFAKSRAKAEIWSDGPGFKAALDKATAASGALVAAANGTDAAAVTAAGGAVGGVCAGCHGAYRGPVVP